MKRYKIKEFSNDRFVLERMGLPYGCRETITIYTYGVSRVRAALALLFYVLGRFGIVEKILE